MTGKRIIGAEYTVPENLERLRQRGLAKKRSLALREFAFGIEGLERFVRREPLRRVRGWVFGVLALESERAPRSLLRRVRGIRVFVKARRCAAEGGLRRRHRGLGGRS